MLLQKLTNITQEYITFAKISKRAPFPFKNNLGKVQLSKDLGYNSTVKYVKILENTVQRKPVSGIFRQCRLKLR